MAKQSMFRVLGTRYPQFRNLSANKFSELNRQEELYPIVRQLREDYPEIGVQAFPNYPTISTVDLGKKVFMFIKNNLV